MGLGCRPPDYARRKTFREGTSRILLSEPGHAPSYFYLSPSKYYLDPPAGCETEVETGENRDVWARDREGRISRRNHGIISPLFSAMASNGGNELNDRVCMLQSICLSGRQKYCLESGLH